MSILIKPGRKFAVWKYIIDDPTTIVNAPKDSRVLRIGTQYKEGTRRETAVLWMLVDLTVTVNEERIFHRIMTGAHVQVKESPMIYIGTAILYDGTFIVHVFEEVSA